MSFITVVCLLCIQTVLAIVYSQDQATQACSTKETRKAAMNEALTHIGCEDYKCGRFIISTSDYNNNYHNAALQKVLYLGVNESNAAISCDAILEIIPSAPSGYYWLQSANGSAVRVFCDMTLTCKGVGGGWMQVAKLDMTNSSHQCPPGTRLGIYDSSRRLCGRGQDDPGCNSSTFSTFGIRYNHVCGMIISYQ